MEAKDQERALADLRKAYRDALALSSPNPHAFANLGWVLAESSDLSDRNRAEAIALWLGGSELDRWRSPILASEAGKDTLNKYDYRKAAAEQLRIAAERLVDCFGIASPRNAKAG